jgi:hypothetical protein
MEMLARDGNFAPFVAFKVIYNTRMCDYVLARGSVVFEALCYKPNGRGFDTR